MEKEVDQEEKVDLDTLLVHELGQFGRFQWRTLASAAIAVIFTALGTHEYLFTTARIKTRCLIPECENVSATVFSPAWITNAVPSSGGFVDSCQRFGNVSTATNITDTDTCPAALFDSDVVFNCHEHVYENTHSVVYDFDLACHDWRRSLFGFVRGVGMFFSLPLTGYVSDRWGRRTALAISAFNTAWLGIARYWATSYSLYMASVAIESFLGGSAFTSAYVLVLELVGPKYRVIAAGAISGIFSMGEALLGILAWAVPNWRFLTLTLYIPQLVSITFFWIFPESIRWYMSKGRYEEAEHCLKKVARINGKQLSENSLHLLRVTAQNQKSAVLDKDATVNEPWLISEVLRRKVILLRCIILPFCWVSMALVLHGLTVNSVNISSDAYLSFIAVSMVQIPGFIASSLLMRKLGRKPVMMGGFWICAASVMAFIFMPNGNYALSLSVYLIGKSSISGVAIGLYVYTSELFPTKYRHNLLAYCSMVGRIGSITAPLTPAIGDVPASNAERSTDAAVSTSQILMTSAGRDSLRVMYEHIKLHSEYIYKELSLHDPSDGDVSLDKAPLLYTMFHIGRRPFDQFLRKEWVTPWSAMVRRCVAWWGRAGAHHRTQRLDAQDKQKRTLL